MAAERGLQLSNNGSNLFIPETKSPRTAVVFLALSTITTTTTTTTVLLLLVLHNQGPSVEEKH